MFSTRFTELFGVRYPMVQGGMTWVGRARLAAASPFGVNLPVLPAIDPPPYDECLRAAVESGVKIIETAGSTPAKLLPYLRDNGVKMIHNCTGVRYALKPQAQIVENSELDTKLIFRTLGNTARVAENSVSVEVIEVEAQGCEFEDIRHLVAGARGRKVFEEGVA